MKTKQIYSNRFFINGKLCDYRQDQNVVIRAIKSKEITEISGLKIIEAQPMLAVNAKYDLKKFEEAELKFEWNGFFIHVYKKEFMSFSFSGNSAWHKGYAVRYVKA